MEIKIKRGLKTEFKIISLILVLTMLLQIVMTMLIPLKSIANDKIEESVTTQKVGDIKLSTSQNTTINAGDEVTVDFIVTGSNIVGIAAYINYDDTIFNEIDTNNIITPFRIDNDAGQEEYGYYISIRDGNNIGASNSTMFSIKFIAKATTNSTTVSINGIWLTQAGRPAISDYGPDDAGYDVSLTFPKKSEEKICTITYNDESGEATGMPGNATVNVGDSYTIATEEPIREGYTFTGWETLNGATYTPGREYAINSNLDLYAQWEETNGTLTVNPNGGVWDGKSTTQTITGKVGTTKTIDNPDPTKTPNGHVIQFNANGGETETLSITQTTTFDRWELTGLGEFQGNTYTYGKGAGTLTAQYRGDSITLPTATKLGATIEGWYTEQTGGTKVGNPGDTWTPDESRTLFAHWDEIKYTLTVNLNGGKVGESTTVAPIKGGFNETVTLPTVTPPEGYTITLNNNYGSNETRTKKQIQRLEKWTTQDGGEITGSTYTFGEKDDTITAVYKREAVTLEEPGTRTGYTFEGWYTEAENGVKVNNEYEPTGDIELFAHWTAEKYTITFNPGNNATVDTTSKEVTYEEKYGELPIPQRPGYEFNGWYNGNEEITADDIVEITNDTTLTAKWLGAEYTVTFDYGDGEGTQTTKTVRNEGTYGQLPEATKEGHEFEGWFDDNGNKIESTTIVNLTQDITLHARYTPKQYTIKFLNDDGSVIEQKTVNHGDTITYTGETPEKGNVPLGYNAVFSGWDNEAKLQNIKEDVTLTATYTLTPITYTITYQNIKNADNSQNPVSYTVEDNNIVLKNLENQGKNIFKGWYTTNDENGVKVTSIDTSKAKDIILYAQWEEDKLYLKSRYYKIGENDIDIYEPNDIYLDKISPETTVTEFINKCETNGNITVINQRGQELQADDLVGTNMTIKVTRHDEEINLTLVVMGDLDGNGLVTPTDLSDVNKIVLKILKVEGAKFKAADIDDSQRITPSDLSDINKTVLKLIKLVYVKK